MRLCLRSQELHSFSVAVIADKTTVHEIRHTQTRPEAFFQLLLGDLGGWEIAWTQLTSIALVAGPGSYTSLRTLTTLANTLAFVLQLPLAKIKATEENKDTNVFPRLAKVVALKGSWVTPIYAHAPHITKPKKTGIL